MPQNLKKCFNEKGEELKGYRIDPVSKFIYHYKSMNKETLRFSTGVKFEELENNFKIPSTVFNKAMKQANAEIARRFKAKNTNINTPVVRDIIAKIVKRYESKPNPTGKKNHTINSVRAAYSKIEEFWGTLFCDQITAERWDQFQDWWDVKYPGFNSFNVTKYMRILRNECIELGYLTLRPKIVDRNKKLQRIKRNKKKDWVYSDEEILALDHACLTDKDKIIVRLGYQNAFRISDALSLKWAQFDFSGKVPVYRFSGEDKAETYVGAPLTFDVVELLNAYPRVDSSPYVFPQGRDPLKHQAPQTFDFEAIKKRAGVSRGTFHSLRHYRLTKDFKNPAFTTIQVCILRRVSLKQAFDDYVHVDDKDLALLQNAGSIETIKRFLSA